MHYVRSEGISKARNSGKPTGLNGEAAKPKPPKSKKIKKLGLVCFAYQTGECPIEERSHASDAGIARHDCAHCAKERGHPFHHPEKDCDGKKALNR